MRCPSCGSKVKRSQSRCPSCGEPLVALRPSFGGAATDVRPELGYAPAMAPSTPERHRIRPFIVILIGIALVVVIACAIALISSQARGVGIQVNEKNFPDSAFRAVVKTYDVDDDGALNQQELSTLTTLDCSSRSIKSLQGVQLLTSLASIDASNNNLTGADLSGITSLTSAYLSNNQLSTITLGNLANLRILDVSSNSLASLDLSSCSRLAILDCTGNSLARLDLSSNREITEVAMDPGQNVTIPIAQGFFPDEGLRASLSSSSVDRDGDGALSERERQALTSLTISDSSTADLTGIAWLSSLTTLDASNTSLTDIDANELPASVTSIKAENAQITNVNLGSLPLLISLDVANNPLTSIDLAQTPNLTTLNVTGCSLTDLDITPCSATLSTLHCDSSINVAGGVARTSTAFPDARLRDVLFSTSRNPNGDDLLTASEISSITELNLSGTGVADLTGLASSLTSLQSLSCNGLTLTSFSCAGFSGLQTLYLSGCHLATLDLSGADSLIFLDVSNNDLTYLATAAAPQLANIVATGNAGLTVIDTRGSDALSEESISHDETCTVITSDEQMAAWEEQQAAAQAADEQAPADDQQEQQESTEGEQPQEDENIGA